MAATSPKLPATQASRLDALTSLRFIAAMAVFVWHVSPYLGTTLFSDLQLGYVGVGFFYILSGFILTYVYIDKIKTLDRVTLKKFYISRVAKLLPVHVLTFLASLPLVIPFLNNIFPENTIAKTAGAAGVNLSLLQAWFPQPSVHFSFNGVAWSISVEMFFYALFPVLIFIISRYLRHLDVLKVSVVIVALWLTVMAIFLPYQAVLDDWLVYIFPPARLVDFVAGILLGVVYMKIPHGRKRLNKIESRRATFSEVAVLLLLSGGLALSIFMPQSLRFGLWLMPFWAMVIIIFAQQKGAISKGLSMRPLVFLGEISFSFYMVHFLVIRYLAELQLNNVAMVVLSLVIAVSISAVLYLFYEEPLRVRIKAKLERVTISSLLARKVRGI